MINNTTEHILALPRPVKRLLALSVDALLCALTVWLALCLRLESWVVLTDNQWLAVGLSLALALPVFVASGLYRAIFRYAGLAGNYAHLEAKHGLSRSRVQARADGIGYGLENTMARIRV